MMHSKKRALRVAKFLVENRIEGCTRQARQLAKRNSCTEMIDYFIKCFGPELDSKSNNDVAYNINNNKMYVMS